MKTTTEERIYLAYLIIRDSLEAYEIISYSHDEGILSLDKEASMFEDFLGISFKDPDITKFREFTKRCYFYDLIRSPGYKPPHSRRTAIIKRYGKELLDKWRKMLKDLGARFYLDPFTVMDTIEDLSHTGIANENVSKHNSLCVKDYFKRLKSQLLAEVQGNA